MQALYIKDWLAIHPYTRQQTTDGYFTAFANQLYRACSLKDIPEPFRKKLCLYTASYLEDIISGLGLWQTFTAHHQALYGRILPFYPVSSDYANDEINEEDIRFILWNTLQKAPYEHPFVHPLHPSIQETARLFFEILDDAYETAPANDALADFFLDFKNEEEATRKLWWLFGRNYLTEPSVQEYIAQVSETDKFIIPCGPLALFLHEWIELLCKGQTARWKTIKGLYPAVRELSEERKKQNHCIYELFVEGTKGHPITYLNGYEELHRFLTQTLQWPDDENHTLPQMKANRNFVLMVHPEKGMLLAKDICECISDPLNPMYDREKAVGEAFSLLTVPTKCPPDLLDYLIKNNYIPDACMPEGDERELLQANADFITRHSLLYYYRGD